MTQMQDKNILRRRSKPREAARGLRGVCNDIVVRQERELTSSALTSVTIATSVRPLVSIHIKEDMGENLAMSTDINNGLGAKSADSGTLRHVSAHRYPSSAHVNTVQ